MSGPDDPDPNSRKIGHLAICGTGLLLGFVPWFKNVLMDQYYCTWIVFFRITIALMTISIVIFVKRCLLGKDEDRFLVTSRKHWFSFVGYGVVSITAVYYFYIKSLTLTTAAISVIAVFTAAPFTTLVVSFLFKKARASKREIFCIIIIVMGCVLVNWKAIGNLQHREGIFYGLLTGLCYGLFSIFGDNLKKHYHYTTMMFWQFFIATLSSIGIVLFVPNKGPAVVDSLQVLAPPELWGILGIGVIATFIPYILYSFGLKKGAKPSTASALTALEPISAAIIAYCFMGEKLSLMQVIGITTVVVSSCFLALRREHLTVVEN